MNHLPPPSGDGDRSSLDEALFGNDLAQATHPDVPPLPAPLVGVPLDGPDAPPDAPRRALRDGGTEYQLAGVAPGLFEMHAVTHDEPEPPPHYVFDEPTDEEPPAYDFSDDPLPLPDPEAPPRPPCTLLLNQPLDLLAGETVVLGPTHLRLVGPEPALIDVMVLSPAEHGAILREGFALTGGDTFTQEDLDAGKISYRHDGGPATADRFTFATPDGDVPPAVFHFAITPSHFAPELRGPGQLAGVLDGCDVAEILDGQATCHEADAVAGIAVVSIVGRGTWSISLDEGQTWAELREAHHSAAVPLRARDRLRFVPRPGWSGSVKLTYRAWDGTQGAAGEPINLAPRDAIGGATAFSKQPASATTQVLPVERELPPMDPWRGEVSVGDLFGGGAAVVRVEGPGEWQYSTDGRSWVEFGKVYHGRARLLRATDRVRFVARRGAAGKVMLSARTWEGKGPTATANLASSASCGGETAFGEYVQTKTWRMSE